MKKLGRMLSQFSRRRFATVAVDPVAADVEGQLVAHVEAALLGIAASSDTRAASGDARRLAAPPAPLTTRLPGGSSAIQVRLRSDDKRGPARRRGHGGAPRSSASTPLTATMRPRTSG